MTTQLQTMSTLDLERLMTELTQEKQRTNARELKRITREQVAILNELERRTPSHIVTSDEDLTRTLEQIHLVYSLAPIVTSADDSGKINCPINCPDPETCPF